MGVLARSLRPMILAPLAAALGVALIVAPALSHAEVRPGDLVSGSVVRHLDEERAAEAPDVDMPAGYLGTADGRELWSRNADERRAVASTTKLMTALVVLRSGVALDEQVTVSAKAASAGQSLVDLHEGDVRSVGQLIDEMLVKSGNDAALALAEHVAGSERAFVRSMNERAREMGLRDTSFRNPHGLDVSGHHSTARDLALLTAEAMREPRIREAVGKRSVEVTTSSGQRRRLENTNLLLGGLEGVVGVKTGMTRDAGWCLISQVERDEVALVAVVLGTRSEGSRVKQSKTLLQWGLEHYGPRIVASAEETVGSVPVSDYLDVAVPAVVKETTSAVLFDLDGEIRREIELFESLSAPVSSGDTVGTLLVMQGERVVSKVPVVSALDVVAPRWWQRLTIGLVRSCGDLLGPEAGERLAAALSVP